MSEDGKDNPGSEEEVQNKNAAGVDRLGRIEKLAGVRARDARAIAARLIKDQDELVRVVGAVRDLAKTAAGLTREIQFLSMAAEDNLQPAARAVLLLARILREIKGLSQTIMATIGSQSATMRELTGIVGEAAKVSTYLTGKVAALAEETQTILPTLSSKSLVDSEIEWLTVELQKTVGDLEGRPENTHKTTADELTMQPPVSTRLAN